MHSRLPITIALVGALAIGGTFLAFRTEGTTQPATAQPATAQPATAQPATAQPATAQPATAQPATAQPATAQPATAQPHTTGTYALSTTTRRPGELDGFYEGRTEALKAYRAFLARGNLSAEQEKAMLSLLVDTQLQYEELTKAKRAELLDPNYDEKKAIADRVPTGISKMITEEFLARAQRILSTEQFGLLNEEFDAWIDIAAETAMVDVQSAVAVGN
jgi:hypothetical protein